VKNKNDSKKRRRRRKEKVKGKDKGIGQVVRQVKEKRKMIAVGKSVEANESNDGQRIDSLFTEESTAKHRRTTYCALDCSCAGQLMTTDQ
jgi:hypothetical protein